MTDNHRVELLKKCIDFIAPKLSTDESIIQVEQGRIIPGRQVFHCYKFYVATMDPTLQNPPSNRRVITVTINQEGSNAVSQVDGIWQPFDHLYGD
jgi:hypothetical protein